MKFTNVVLLFLSEINCRSNILLKTFMNNNLIINSVDDYLLVLLAFYTVS